MQYTHPTCADLRALKEELGRTGEEMAALFGLAGGQQWRKYTGGEQPRSMSPQMLFFAAAHLELTPEQLRLVFDRMRRIGAKIDGVEFEQVGASCRTRVSLVRQACGAAVLGENGRETK